MSFPGDILRVSFLFGVKGTLELAQTSMCFSIVPSAAGALEDPNTALESDFGPDAAALYATMMADTNWASYSYIAGVKAATQRWTTVGSETGWHYTNPPYLWEAPDTTIDGTAGQTLPQGSICLSFRTEQTFGKGNIGRMYLPHSFISLVADSPYANETEVETVAGNAADFVGGMNGLVQAGYPAITFAIVSTVGTGSAKIPDNVLVGRVNDTQRRRREQLDEQYFSQAL